MKQTTKQAIQDSFRSLLMAKSLDKITVRDIVEDCGLTRNTFYYHYEDIYDLFDDYLDTQMKAACQDLPPGSPWDEGLIRMLDGVFATPQMGRHIFYSRKRDTMRQYLNRATSAVIERYVDQMDAGMKVSSADKRLLCDVCSYALYGLLEQCLTGPEAALLQTRLRRVTRAFEQAIHQALLYCATHPNQEEEA